MFLHCAKPGKQAIFLLHIVHVFIWKKKLNKNWIENPYKVRCPDPRPRSCQAGKFQATKFLERQYCQRVVNIDRGVFTPLVFSTSGVIGRECEIFLKTLASEICSKHKDLRYPAVMGAIRAKLEFVILRWNITCLRGSRRLYTHKRSFLQECRLHWQVKTFCPYLSSFSPSLSLSLSLSLSVSLCLSLSSLSLSHSSSLWV